MQAPFLRGLLDRLDRRGVLSCACGGRHRIAVGEVIVADDGLARAAGLLARRHGPKPTVWVLSDENTEAAAGERWKSMARAEFRSRVLPALPKPAPTLELAGELVDEVRQAAPDLLVAVGGGVVSDLVKKVSLDAGTPSWCIATAPSVDAYTSATSSLRTGGYHESIPARISEVIVCDLDVLGRAPRPLILAGLGDLLAKFLAYLDWNVAGLVAGEHFCAAIAELALGSARVAIAAARELERAPLAAAASLTDAILVSGLAMQAMGNSRPAASAEHTIAHFWETAHAVHSAHYELHGILVGAATALILPGYRSFYSRLEAIEPESWPAPEQALEEGLRPYAAKIASETRARPGEQELAARREAFAREKLHIAGLAGPLLAELAEAVGVLERLGFPFSLDELAIPEPLRLLPVRNVRLLRRRYTTFDLAHELGVEQELLGPIADG